jgi:glutathione S-transferase
MGYVPAIETRDGMTLTEGPAVLSYIADLAAEGVLAPPPYTPDRYRMTGWLNFVSTEIHKAVFHPLLARYSSDLTSTARDGARAYARALAPGALQHVSDHLEGREFLLDQFSVADAYLLAVLNWCETAGIAIGDWPVLMHWRTKMRMRPSVQRAMAAELPLLKPA